MINIDLQRKYEILTEEANKTMSESLDKLQKHGKVMVVRPTGFGKTRMLVNITKEYAKKYPDKRIAYIFPLKIIVTEITTKDAYMKDGIFKKQVDFISYQDLTLKQHNNKEGYWLKHFKDKYSLIVLDEVHCAGSEGFLEVYEGIKEIINASETHLIGATATPNRMYDTDELNVFSTIFDNIGVSKYDLYDCFKDGIMNKMVYGARQYDLAKLADDLRLKKRRELNKDFDEKVFNLELSKIIKSSGTEASYIYKYLKLAGYNLADPKDKYFKFIVFFTNIADMEIRGPEVEEWFNEAFNNVAKEDLGLRKKFDIRSYYVASKQSEEINKLIKQSKGTRKFFNDTSLVSTIQREDYKVELLFTVNMINMGYHVDDITGIMMLRGTKSEIVYYQQLGRCLSVTNERNPIVYDMVRNKDMKFWNVKDRMKEIQKQILESNSFSEYSSDSGREPADLESLDLFITGDSDEFEDFMNRWSDNSYSQKAKVSYLYNEKKAPLCVISQHLSMKCTDIAKILTEMNIEIVPEIEMFKQYERIYRDSQSTSQQKQEALSIIKYIYCKQAFELYKKEKNTEETVYKAVQKVIK